MKRMLFLLALCSTLAVFAQPDVKLKKRDRRRDVEVTTTAGVLVLRLSDSTPLHRDNFLKLVKAKFYDSVLFHRVIKGFMIQGGDPASIRAAARVPLGGGGPGYTVPAEIRSALFHKKGALAAARLGDAQNPERRSSGSQFYLVQGKTFTDAQLDSIETARLQGRKILAERREYYRTVGGTPQLDGNYTVFGEVVSGLDLVDSIANGTTSSGADRDRPLQDVRILKTKLVKRRK